MTTIGSLFSGVGGLERGLESVIPDARVIWQAESDPAARRVLERWYPDVRRYTDVREIDGRAERPDIICGGFPCQDISVAGAGAGIGGARSGLWVEFARILRALKPAVVFIENVPALASRGLDEVLRDLAACGLDAEWDCFSAADVGAPHKRERIFVLAYANRIAGGQGRRGLVERLSTARTITGWIAEPGGRSGQASGDLANAARDGRREGQSESTGREGRPSTGASGDSIDLADADGGRCEGQRLAQSGRVERAPGREPDGRGHLGYVHRFPPGPAGIVAWDGAQPAVRRGDARVPFGMDRGWRTKNRIADRLRLLGNACCPQQAALAFITLAARAAEAAEGRAA